jgi:hypothetical protein
MSTLFYLTRMSSRLKLNHVNVPYLKELLSCVLASMLLHQSGVCLALSAQISTSNIDSFNGKRLRLAWVRVFVF